MNSKNVYFLLFRLVGDCLGGNFSVNNKWIGNFRKLIHYFANRLNKMKRRYNENVNGEKGDSSYYNL